jgi:hypothetical protein
MTHHQKLMDPKIQFEMDLDDTPPKVNGPMVHLTQYKTLRVLIVQCLERLGPMEGFLNSLPQF